MAYEVVKKQTIKSTQRSIILKYTISNTYHVLIINNSKPIVYDYDINIEDKGWYMMQVGYVCHSAFGYMHRHIAQLSNLTGFEDASLSVDHINREKNDNRVKNLRMATQSEQNSNRDTRSDKKPPCDELIKIGIIELPKYVRWDNSEKKFIIEKHPQLLHEVQEEKRKKAVMSGSKSAKLSITQKYQDILARLEELDKLFRSDMEFENMRILLKKEYDDICECIQTYEGHVKIEEVKISTIPIEAIRNTAPGRKLVSKLPEGCGVRIEEVPKYCIYVAKKEKTSDHFLISKYHPKLKGSTWSTTSLPSYSTLDKFNILKEKLVELEKVI